MHSVNGGDLQSAQSGLCIGFHGGGQVGAVDGRGHPPPAAPWFGFAGDPGPAWFRGYLPVILAGAGEEKRPCRQQKKKEPQGALCPFREEAGERAGISCGHGIRFFRWPFQTGLVVVALVDLAAFLVPGGVPSCHGAGGVPMRRRESRVVCRRRRIRVSWLARLVVSPGSLVRL